MSQPNPTSEITVVTVAYHSMGVLPDMLASLPAGMPVVIVDNAPKSEAGLEDLAAKYGAQLIRNAANLGFGAGCNRGAAAARTPYLMFLNPDARVELGCLDALLEAARRYPDATGFNPRTLDHKGRVKFKRRSNLLPRSEWLSAAPEADHAVPVLTGAAIFAARAVFERVGGFDEDIFLYYEDDDLSLRLACHGPLMHIPGAVVYHNDGHSTARSPATAQFKAFHLARSRVFAQTKHGVRWPWARVMLRAVAQLFSPLMLNGRKRAKYLGYLSGALSALKDGGRSRARGED